MLILKAETRERVAILGIKSNYYVCLDSEGVPYSSVRTPSCSAGTLI